SGGQADVSCTRTLALGRADLADHHHLAVRAPLKRFQEKWHRLSGAETRKNKSAAAADAKGGSPDPPFLLAQPADRTIGANGMVSSSPSSSLRTWAAGIGRAMRKPCAS